VSLSDYLIKGIIKVQSINNLIKSTEGEGYTLNSDKYVFIMLSDLRSTTSPFYDEPYQLSQLYLPNESLTFKTKGEVISANGFILSGFWGNVGLSSTLPDDYNVISEESLRYMALESLKSKPYTYYEANLIDKKRIEFYSSIQLIVKRVVKKSPALTEPDFVYYLKPNDSQSSITILLKRLPGVIITTNPDDNGAGGQFITITGNNNKPVAVMVDGFLFEPSRSFDIINQLRVKDIERLELIKYNTSMLGVRGGGGVVAIYSRGV
jgi:hypothetical protein